MALQKLPQTDVADSRVHCIETHDDIALLAAASEFENTLAGWLIDQRAIAAFDTERHAV